MNIPEGLFYTNDHEWVKIDGDMATIGITDYAQSSLGDITFIELPDVDSDVQKSSVLATVESVKAASDVYAPLTGRIVKVNQAIVDNPELVNQSPYEKAWFAVMQVKNHGEMEKLLSPSDYKEHLDRLIK